MNESHFLNILLVLLITSFILDSEGNLCDVYYDDDFIQLVQRENCPPFSHLRSTLSDFLSVILPINSTVVDVAAGFGTSFIPFAKVLGSVGTIIAIEKSKDHFTILQQNAAKSDSWGRTLLLNGNPSNISSSQRVTSIVNQLGLGCPQLIRFNHHDNLSRYETYTSLLGAFSVLESCQPVLLIDCDSSDMAGCVSTLELLAHYATPLLAAATGAEAAGQDPYKLYWHTITMTWSNPHAGVDSLETEGPVHEKLQVYRTLALLALPPGHPAAAAVALLEASSNSTVRSVRTHDCSRFDPLLPTLWEETALLLADPSTSTSTSTSGSTSGSSAGVVQEGPSAAAAAGRTRTTLSVHLTDVTALNSTLYKVLSATSSSGSKGEGGEDAHAVRALREAGLHVLRVIYDFSATDRPETLELVATARCFLWSRRILQFIMNVHTTATAKPRWQQELVPVQPACAAFLSKRFRTTHRILAMRWDQQLQDQGHAQVVAATTGSAGVAVLGEGLEDLSGIPTRRYAYYQTLDRDSQQPLSSAEVLGQWFERPPLSARHDEGVCGEPIWCDHALEMQRRIRAWQHPEEPSAPLPQHLRESTGRPAEAEAGAGTGEPGSSNGGDFSHLLSDWSVRENATRASSCAHSKFLVYEPPSSEHGLGSMLELIGFTFRYAICLDRILVLNPYNQSRTLTKWMHPGCKGSFVECYFEPVTSCHLSEAEVAAAPVSHDGYKFDSFPLRDQRVLVLKGMPLAGKCTLCHNEWRADSRFFDGLFMGDSAYDLSVALLHMSAFRSNIKLTWASQFLRFLLRPRPWVQEALAQLTHYSMRSPATASAPEHGSDIDGRTQPEAGGEAGDEAAAERALPPHSFPSRFLSLHVRFGMKVAEATLQPLSKYMDFAARKLPHLKDVFVSTETEEVIHTLISEYPGYRFHYMRYPRREYLDLGLQYQHSPHHRDTDFVDETLYALANLHAAAEAQGFVGTLSSNWCMMIMQLERTRGDGGFDYYSMDKGSAFTSCF